MSIDLHTHSSASDGSESPAEVLASAARAGLDVLALTDHDTTAGWERAATAAMHHGIALVRGIEVSCQHRGVSIHLLGYLQDPASPGLLAELDRSKMSRETRARRIVGLLSRDLPLDWDDVLAHVEPGATIGRPHIAAAMLDKHIVTSIASAFDSYLKDGSPYYVGQAGGVAVMAHPFAASRGAIVDDSVIEAMAAAGMAGLEVHHPDHSGDQVRHGTDLASSLGLFVTGSSDYHGDRKPNWLGQRTTDPVVLQQIEDLATGVEVLRP
jgi:predicted metal-dependent phosphoesterase TrpH